MIGQIFSRADAWSVGVICGDVGCTRCRTPVHKDLSSGPAYLGIMFYEPGVSEDDGRSANACDMEGGSFRVISILDQEVDDFGDVASIIEGPIYIVDTDGSREMLGAQILGSDIININELAGGPRVDEGIYQQWGVTAYGMDAQGKLCSSP